ncbi:sigma factor-like helix-turn-helix DNA-binding protein [Streptomyces sp. RLB1-33]|nr:sigma-70 region 4 domain-containing protein [Streptomyces sp. RLB1-33]QIY76147.1 hypothetical protein HEP84_51780 [Streptomyces sp. RLB1-33]
MGVAEKLRRVPVNQRPALLLHDVLDLPIEQVAEQLGLPVSTMRGRFARAWPATSPPIRKELCPAMADSERSLRDLVEEGSRASPPPPVADLLRRARRRSTCREAATAAAAAIP